MSRPDFRIGKKAGIDFQISKIAKVLLGRSAELGLVEQLVDEVRAGRALLVTGPPGIGKTALLEHAVGQATPETRVLRAAGVENEAEMPYSALHLLLRPVLGEIDELPDPQADALRGAFGMAATDAVDPLLAGFAVLTLLSGLAAERPLLCLVDDGHCVDLATVEVVRFVARRLADEPIGILFAAREDDGRVRSTTGLPRLHLTGLAPDAAEALLGRAAPHLPRHLREPLGPGRHRGDLPPPDQRRPADTEHAGRPPGARHRGGRQPRRRA
ncbi:ATP-binding protein [Actinoallomurus vinaceus]